VPTSSTSPASPLVLDGFEVGGDGFRRRKKLNRSKDERLASSYFIRNVMKGRVLTTAEIRQYARRNGLALGRGKINNLRSRWISTALRRSYVRPSIFQTISIPKLVSF
jgi:hypothetical protein